MNRDTGQPLAGWPHVEQSIRVILTTPIGSRLMRREFGSEVPNLVGRPLTTETILAIYAATAAALARWEPRYSLTGVSLASAGPDGRAEMILRGEYAGDVVDTEVTIA